MTTDLSVYVASEWTMLVVHWVNTYVHASELILLRLLKSENKITLFVMEVIVQVHMTKVG